MEMARGVGTPLQLDPMTKEGKFDFDARILVDVDLSKPLPEYIMIEREGYGFPVDVVYEKLPPLCDFCGLIGHNSSACRQNNKKKDSEPAKPKVKQIYRVKAPISEIPESTQEPGNHTNTNPLTENLQIIDRVVDPDTHANNSVDPAKEISLNPEISHDDNTMLSNPTELDALESDTVMETKSMGSNPLPHLSQSVKRQILSLAIVTAMLLFQLVTSLLLVLPQLTLVCRLHYGSRSEAKHISHRQTGLVAPTPASASAR